MKLHDFPCAVFIAIPTISLTILANIRQTTEGIKNCATYLTVGGTIYDRLDNIVPSSIKGGGATPGSYSLAIINCRNSGKFCCAQLNPLTHEILQIIEME